LRRDATRIIFEILSLSSGGASKTRIIRKLGLNFPIAMKYIKFLTERDHLQLVLFDGVLKYVLTNSGEILLSYLLAIEKELDAFFGSSKPTNQLDNLLSTISLSGSPLYSAEHLPTRRTAAARNQATKESM
jgi:predicted transcriptional regulator